MSALGSEGLFNFYPRPPRGGRHCGLPFSRLMRAISIHALREEGDSCHVGPAFRVPYFYPRPPRGGRPATGLNPALTHEISIHALREEGDLDAVLLDQPLDSDFYPRPPRGGRRQAVTICLI